MKLNPPAFPLSDVEIPCHQEGMTLLDYFAGQVAEGRATTDAEIVNPSKFASHCYEIADYMLDARQRKLQELKRRHG